jgi:hypothetical protein
LISCPLVLLVKDSASILWRKGDEWVDSQEQRVVKWRKGDMITLSEVMAWSGSIIRQYWEAGWLWRWRFHSLHQVLYWPERKRAVGNSESVGQGFQPAVLQTWFKNLPWLN